MGKDVDELKAIASDLLQRIESLKQRLERLEETDDLGPVDLSQEAWVPVDAIAEFLGVSERSVGNMRSRYRWLENIHWKRVSGNSTILYNRPILAHWHVTLAEPQEHQKKVRQYIQAIQAGAKPAAECDRRDSQLVRAATLASSRPGTPNF